MQMGPTQPFKILRLCRKLSFKSPILAVLRKTTQNSAIMDPMESMSASGGRVPNNFNADDAQNMEDVR
jgi:hypothetical protein